jgi:hypothetical protein
VSNRLPPALICCCAAGYVMALVDGVFLILYWLRGRYGIRRLIPSAPAGTGIFCCPYATGGATVRSSPDAHSAGRASGGMGHAIRTFQKRIGIARQPVHITGREKKSLTR